MERILGKKNALLNWWMDTESDSPSTISRFIIILIALAAIYSFSLYKVIQGIHAANPKDIRAEVVYMPPGAQIVTSFTNVSSQGGIALPIVELSLEQYKAKAGENSLHYIVINEYNDMLNPGSIPLEYFAKNESSTHIFHTNAHSLSYFNSSRWGEQWPTAWTIKEGRLMVKRTFNFYNMIIIGFIITGLLLFISIFFLTNLWNKRIDVKRVAMMNPK